VLEQRIAAQRIGIILVLVPTGDLVEALGDQGGQIMPAASGAPVGNDGGEGGRQPQRLVGCGEPGQPAVTRQAATEEIHLQGHRTEGGKRQGLCGRLHHAGHLRDGNGFASFPYQSSAPVSLMNNPG